VVKVKWGSQIWSTTMDMNFHLRNFQSKLAILYHFSTIIIFFFLDSSLSTSVNSGERESVETWKKQTLSNFINHVGSRFFLSSFISFLLSLACLLTECVGVCFGSGKGSGEERKKMTKIYEKKETFIESKMGLKEKEAT